MAINVGSVSVDIVPDGSQFRRRMDAIARNLSITIQVEADTAAAQAKLDELGKSKSATVNVDADTSRAQAKIDLLSKSHDTKVNVDADTARAREKIDLVARDREAKVDVNVDDHGSGGRVAGIAAAILSLGPALIPIAAVSAAAFGALAAGALAAGAGVGALVLGFSGVGAAVTAMGKAQDSAAADAKTAAAAQVASAAQIASAQSSLTGAEAGLANARASAADAAVTAAQRVTAAQAGVVDTERAVAQAVAQAAQQVTAARVGVADATRTAAQGVAAAQSTLVSSERNLVSAQQASLTAQQSLTQARLAARDAMQALNFQVQDGNLSERQAKLSIEQAKAALDALGPTALQVEKAMSTLALAQDKYAKIATNPKVSAAQKDAAKLAVESAQATLNGLQSNVGGSDLQQKQAQLAYDQAIQHLTEVQAANAKLATQKAASDKAGVAGSTQVTAAQKAAAAATQGVADAQTNVRDAEAKVAEARRAGAESVSKAQIVLANAQATQVRAQEDGARRIASAQQSVTDAIRAQAAQQRQSSASIASAQRSVASAQAALQAALVKTGTTGSTSMQALQKAMEDLSPAGQRFAKFIFGLKPALDQLKGTAQSNLLPGVESGIKAVLPLLPTFNKIIGNAAKALGDLAGAAGRGLGSPLFRKFFDYIGATAGPNIKIFGGILGELAKGFAGLVLAFAPITATIIGGLGDLAKKFGDFGANAGKKGSGFQGFLAYVQENMPKVVAFLGDLFKAVGSLLVLFAPFGAVMLTVVDAILKFISAADPKLLAGIAIGIGAIGIAIAIAMDANPIGLIITALALVAAGFAYLWKHSQTFRSIVTGVLNAFKVVGLAVFHAVVTAIGAVIVAIKAIGAFATWLYEKAFKPAINAIGAIVNWLWRNVIQPAFHGISIVVSIAWDIIKAIFILFVAEIKVLGAIATWLWKNAFAPALAAIGKLISYLWDKVGKPYFKLIGDGLSALGGVASWLWDKAFKPALGFIAGAFKQLKDDIAKPIEFVVNTIFDKGIVPFFNAIAKFTGQGTRLDPIHLSTGGPAQGPGTATSDSIPAMLSNNEHVWTAREVANAGGHKAMEAMRAQYRYANGGPVIFQPTLSGRQNPTYPGHSGIDFFGRVGDAIIAAVNSRISYTGSGKGYGDAIFATAANGLQMVYGHTSAILAKVGQVVQGGQRIGNIGYSGNVRPPGPAGAHLHFEVAPNGRFDLASNRDATAAWLKGADVNHFGGGGGPLQNAIGSVIDFLSGPLGKVKGYLSQLKDVGGKGVIGKAIATVPGRILDWAKGLVGLSGGSSGPVPGGTGVARWGPTIQKAMGLTSMPAGTFDNWMQQVATESGGNPNVTQTVHDINSGVNPAKGLLQVIAPTFAAYRSQSLPNNVFDPLANAYAAMNYARSRYGLSRIESVIGHGHGYADGTNSAKAGMAWVGERGPELVRFKGGETVYNARASATIAAGSPGDTNNFYGYNVDDVFAQKARSDRDKVTMANLRGIGV